MDIATNVTAARDACADIQFRSCIPQLSYWCAVPTRPCAEAENTFGGAVHVLVQGRWQLAVSEICRERPAAPIQPRERARNEAT